MTEAEWLTTSEVGDMESLLFDVQQFSARKMRLVSLAACRHIAHLLPPLHYLPVLATAEEYIDGLTDPRALLDLCRHLATIPLERYPAATNAAIRAVLSLGPENAPDAATLDVVDARGFAALVQAGCIAPTLTHAEAGQAIANARGTATHEVFTRACEAEEAAIADLLRDVFGNPFRPMAVEPAWLAWEGGTIAKLAQGIYGEGAFDRLPILADALEEAGCASADLLSHCRGPGPHVRGCWLVDALLDLT
jgi:hypothetical protein